MLRNKLSRFVLTVVLICFSLLFGQTSAPKAQSKTTTTEKAKAQGERRKPRKEEPERLWLERAEVLTQEIREDEWRLERYQRPLLVSRIAEAWWKVDSKRARLWMDSAVGNLEFQPRNESLADAQKRIATAETVTTIALPLDHTYADRLLNVVSEGIERAAKNVSTKDDRTELSHLTMKLTDIGRVAARAKEFAASDRVYRTLLKLKDGNNLQSLFISLRQSDATHADKLFGEALEATRTEYDPLLLFGLAQLAYPDLEREPWMLPAEDLRRRFLDIFSDAFLRVPQDEEEQTKICHLQFDAGRLISKYPPDRMGAMQSVLDDCKHRQRVPKIEATIVEKKLESTDDFLKAAEAGEDARDRALYKVRAAQKAHEAKDFVRALEIVNSLTEDERGAHPAWVSEHNSYEYDALLELYRRHDYPALQRVMDKSPRRPQTLLTVAQVAFEEENESFGTLMLSEARRALENTQVDEPLFYWLFLNTYAKHMPSESAVIFKEAVTGLNGIKLPAPDAGFRWSPLSYDFRPLAIAPQLLELEPQYVSATIKVLDSPQERATFRLSLLRGTLRRYEELRKERVEKRAPNPAQNQRARPGRVSDH